MKLAAKRAIITGAGSGYGLGMARRFAAEGARVVCADIDGDAAEAAALAATGPGGAGLGIACDVSDGASVKAMVGMVERELAGFDILVNNAALTQKPARMAKTSEHDVDRLLAVNIKCLYHMAVHAMPVLRKQGGGVVINISSVGALRPRPGMAWYNATKAAMLTLTQSMAAEFAPDRIRVNAIAPVAGRTPMLNAMFGDDVDAGVARLLETIPLGRLAEPEDIAGAAVFLASDDASFITGIVLPVDGGRLVG
ncbi:MAG: SDR family oxidoreductase [Burkholderiales bacterium]